MIFNYLIRDYSKCRIALSKICYEVTNDNKSYEKLKKILKLANEALNSKGVRCNHCKKQININVNDGTPGSFIYCKHCGQEINIEIYKE